MHDAPPVDYPVGRSVVWVPFLGIPGLLLAGMAADGLLQAISHPDGAGQLVPAGLLLASLFWCGLALRQWRHQPAGRLRWMPDPADPPGWGWFWCEGDAAGPCSVRGVIDLESIWLVRTAGLERGGRVRWVWLSASADPARWLDLRRAVWASRGNPEELDRSVIFPRA